MSGRPSAAADGGIDFDRLTRAQIEAAVWSRTRAAPRGDHDLATGPHQRSGALRPAAVLCGVVERADGWRVILTRRADTLNRHAGQVAFPGGKIDAADASPLAAALREAREEIGLTAEQVEVLGAIDPYETSTGFVVTPFVGLVCPAFRPIPDAGEVAEVFETPLGFLMNPANHQRQLRGRRGVAYAMPYAGYDIWGATAGMLRNLSERLILAAPLSGRNPAD